MRLAQPAVSAHNIWDIGARAGMRHHQPLLLSLHLLIRPTRSMHAHERSIQNHVWGAHASVWDDLIRGAIEGLIYSGARSTNHRGDGHRVLKHSFCDTKEPTRHPNNDNAARKLSLQSFQPLIFNLYFSEGAGYWLKFAHDCQSNQHHASS